MIIVKFDEQKTKSVQKFGGKDSLVYRVQNSKHCILVKIDQYMSAQEIMETINQALLELQQDEAREGKE